MTLHQQYLHALQLTGWGRRDPQRLSGAGHVAGRSDGRAAWLGRSVAVADSRSGHVAAERLATGQSRVSFLVSQAGDVRLCIRENERRMSDKATERP